MSPVKENGAELDLSGSLDGSDFTGAQGLGQAMHDSPGVPTCLVEKLYRSAVGRAVADSEGPYLEYLFQTFAAQGYRVPDLMRAIALSKTFYSVTPPAPPAKTNTAEAAKKGDRS